MYIVNVFYWYWSCGYGTSCRSYFLYNSKIKRRQIHWPNCCWCTKTYNEMWHLAINTHLYRQTFWAVICSRFFFFLQVQDLYQLTWNFIKGTSNMINHSQSKRAANSTSFLYFQTFTFEFSNATCIKIKRGKYNVM